MSLEKLRTVKLILFGVGESRRGWIRLGNDAIDIEISSFPESKHNRCHASSHRHGGVCGVGMLRSVIEKSREIRPDAKINEAIKATRITSHDHGKGVVVCAEVGVARSSDEAPVMGCGAKGPYLVDVNSEGKDMRWL